MIARVTKRYKAVNGNIEVLLRVNQKWKCFNRSPYFIIQRDNIKIELDKNIFHDIFEIIEE